MARALALGLPISETLPGGGRREVADVDENGAILYRQTCNANAAISTGASLLRQTAPYNLDGNGIKVGVWDGGSARNTHQEFNTNRVVKRDVAAPLDDHATHVAGTIGASGVQASAKGMAPLVAIDSYYWDNDVSEMLAAGATNSTDTAKIPLSNHSYGSTYSDVATDTTFMGRYTSQAASNDSTAASTPFYLLFWAAGNDQTRLSAKGGYQSMTFESLGKNALSVGAVNDAVSGGVRAPASGTMSSFSSWGPADDGRIKPDVVANGVSVYSSLATSDTSYASWNGTSMATPNAAGSAALLVELYKREFSGQFMRGSLLKGLLIHTADDLGNAGPDYKFGWGLINVKAAADLILAHKSVTAHPKFFENTVTSGTKTRTHTFQWNGTSPIRATLCWTDPAGAAQADNSRTAVLRHNLDLKITAPDGTTVYQPYVMPFVGTWTDASMSSLATTGKNNVDNVEQVYLAMPTQAGTYTVTVSLDGNLIAGQTQQVYSLVVSGSSMGTPPTISDILDQTSAVGSAVGPLSFTVNDAETAASSLTLSAASSNATLVPVGNITFGGSGTNRTIAITPVTGITGSSTITVTVSDGTSTTSDSFVLTVNAAPDIAVEEYRGSDSSSVSTYGDNVFVGRNGGDGFGAWTGSASGAGGNYIGATSVRSRSFAVYAGAEAGGNSAEATRPLGTALAVGESVAVQLGYTGIANGGEIGMNFFSGGSFRLGLKFIGGSDQWVLNAGGSNFGTGIGWAGGTPLQVVFRRNAGNGYSIMLVSGSRSYSASSLTSTSGVMSIDSVQFYSSAQGASEHLGFDGLTRGLDVANVSPLDLGSVQVGATGSARTIVVRNDGGATLSSISSAKSGTNPNDFVTGGSLPASLAAGAGASLTLALSPTAVGDRSATFSVTSNDPDEGTVNFNLNGTATQGTATVVLGNSSQTYDGTGRAVSVSTTPPGLSIGVTYDGSASAPTNVGTYAVVATVTDPNYEGTGSGTLTVAKASANVALGNLNQTYDGTPRPVSVTTTPPGLSASVIYNGSVSVPNNAGTYSVVVTVEEANYAGSATNTLTVARATPVISQAPTAEAITYGQSLAASSLSGGSASVPGSFAFTLPATVLNAGSSRQSVTFTPSDGTNYEPVTTNVEVSVNKASATVQLGDLLQAYDSMPKNVTVTTTPPNLATSVTYDGSAVAPTDIGSYAVVATVTDPNYEGSVSGTLQIGKQSALINLSGLEQTYDGLAKPVTVSTDPPGLSVALTYDGSPDAPVDAGAYTVVAAVDDTNYQGSVTNTLTVAKAVAGLVFDGLNQTYDGTARAVSVSTTPVGLNASVTYDGNASAPTNAGSYSVVAAVDDANYAGSATNTLTVSQATPVINQVPAAEAITYGQSLGASILTGGSASVSGSFAFTAPAVIPAAGTGSQSVTFTPSDGTNYEPVTTNVEVVVNKAAATVQLGDLLQTYNGTARAVTVMTTPPGLPSSVTYNGASSAPTNVGTYAVAATVTDPNYEGSASGTLEVTLSGVTFASLFGDTDPASDSDQDGLPALVEYALGGATNSNDIGLLPSLVPGSRMSLVATVRTNNVDNLSVNAQFSTALASGWSATLLPGVRAGDQSNVPANFERRVFFFDAGTNAHTFMRLRFSLQPASP